MSEEHEDGATWRSRLYGTLTIGSRRPWLASGLVLLVFVIAAVSLWNKYGRQQVPTGPEYQVTLDGVQLTEQPTWVPGDIRAEVFRDAGWDSDPPSLLDPELALNVARTFELHSWVRKVNRVTKEQPSGVSVEVEYRQAVAMVEVDYQGQSGLLPVDAEGVLLPPDAFTAEEANDFPRIRVDFSGPSGPVGTPWGDPRVWAGSQIAASLLNEWHDWKLYRLVYDTPVPPPPSPQPAEFTIHTEDGHRIRWGRAPGEEKPGEASVEQKRDRLARFAASGQLTGGGPRTIDLRDAHRVSGLPRNSGN